MGQRQKPVAVTEKVLAYVVRQAASDWQLLVFEHAGDVEAGVQVPAGTVELGETLETALWRELFEESGLRPPQVELLGKLAEAPQPERNAVPHIYLFRASQNLPPAWRQIVAGSGQDQGLLFEYRWVDLSSQPRLAGNQGRWLALIDQSLSQLQARS